MPPPLRLLLLRLLLLLRPRRRRKESHASHVCNNFMFVWCFAHCLFVFCGCREEGCSADIRATCTRRAVFTTSLPLTAFSFFCIFLFCCCSLPIPQAALGLKRAPTPSLSVRHRGCRAHRRSLPVSFCGARKRKSLCAISMARLRDRMCWGRCCRCGARTGAFSCSFVHDALLLLSCSGSAVVSLLFMTRCCCYVVLLGGIVGALLSGG